MELKSEIVDHFCIDENTFKQFLTYFQKELVRLKLTFLYEDDEISNVLDEKIDYKLVGKDESNLEKAIVGVMDDLGLFQPSILLAISFPSFLGIKEKSVNSLFKR